MRKFVLLNIISFIFVLNSFGQDPVFSQFNQASNALNPALSGNFQGKLKLAVNYRDQWYSLVGIQNSYKTAYTSFDYKFDPNKKNVFTIGGMFIQDTAGEGNFKQIRGHITGSYNMQLSEGGYGKFSNYISIGTQIGFGQNSVEWGNLWFGRQFDKFNLSVNQSLDSGEPVPSDQNFKTGVYPDLNLGIAWSGIESRRLSAHAGIAMAHINSPSISNYGTIYDRYLRRLTINGGAKFLMNSDLGIIPAFAFYNQGPSYLLQIGSSFSYSLIHLGESGFRAGSYLRIANSVNGTNLEGLIVSALFEKQNLQIGVSYDFTLSGLRLAVNSLGGFEISICYISPDDSNYSSPRVPGY